jgi:hypothetical protein
MLLLPQEEFALLGLAFLATEEALPLRGTFFIHGLEECNFTTWTERVS